MSASIKKVYDDEFQLVGIIELKELPKKPHWIQNLEVFVKDHHGNEKAGFCINFKLN